MEIRHLRYFLAVATELHFGRAARHLHMSQPPLSARIRDLEHEVGTPLFERTSRGVALTPAGHRFLPAARHAVDAFEQAQRVAGALRARPGRTLHVAITPDTSAATVQDFVAAIDGVTEDPTVRITVEITEASTGEQTDTLHSGRFDLGMLRHPFPGRGLHVEPALATPVGAIMAATHPLAGHDAVSATDLDRYPLVVFPRQMAPGLYDETVAALTALGLQPSTGKHITRLLSALLASDNAIAIRNPGLSITDNLVWRPISDLALTWRTSVVWPVPPTCAAVPLLGAALADALVRHERWCREPA
ncbi:LysR family transcriptional regulator [Actinophytocola oryzae]|uniref:DNA-binding transcriptional LysR family regulator n=1 Tax=Actinophytocola oryzae TaxID=502181 RepID=A0A4R7VVM7_9PSEU|nr:LysR family transcriptional regulator [Actinophytocola oryzae]TDV53954.1 DNA-binding transcriptional LysR family regulator [Actinophytocola oryzae]